MVYSAPNVSSARVVSPDVPNTRSTSVRVIPSLSLWAGTDHQFPIYETISWAGTYTVLACLHYFRDDRGRSLPERGIDALHIRSGRLRTKVPSLANSARPAGSPPSLPPR